VHNTVSYSTDNLNKFYNNHDLEACAIQSIILPNIYNILFIYRPPMGNFTTFLMHLEAILTQLHINAGNLIVCGDINVNYLQDSRNKSLLNSLLASFNLYSAANFPTRISNISSTTIDNNFIDKNKNKYHSIIPISNGLSDHDAQIIQLRDVDIPTQQIKPRNKRVINEAAIAQFKINLSYESCYNVFNDEDLGSSYNNFLNIYLRIHYNSFPTQKVHINNNNKSWLTNGIRNSCQKKRDLYLIYKHTDNFKLRNY